MKIIGISGKLGSGKTLLANKLTKYGFEKVSLATPLKQMCGELYNLTDSQLYGEDKDNPTKYVRTDGSFYTPRDILIREGFLKRSINPLFWCEKLKAALSWNLKYVVDDIRFKNEVNFFQSLGAKLVRIEREQQLIGKPALDDPSETELDNYSSWDFVLLEPFNRVEKDLDTFAEYLSLHV